jgi:hypothetical protein
MNFKELNTLLSSKAFDLCALLLPGGKRQGKEFVAGSVEGEKGQSLHVTIEGPKAGRWKDFAADEGGDMIALIERSKGLSPIQAANWARSWLGLPEWTPDNNTPPPFNPLTMGFKNRNESEWRKGSAAWTYHDENGVPVAWVVRFDTPGGGKSVMPIRIVDGKHRWKGYTGTEKRPLYNLHKIHSRPDAPILIVEGEKTADAAAQLFPGYVVTTWMGGTENKNKADWSPLLERKTPVVLWADADKPGRKAMAYIAQLIDGSKRVKTVDLPEKWDLADPVPDGIDINARIDKALATDPDAEKRAKAAAKKEAEEGEVKYHLPYKCELSKVESDILKYKVFTHGSQVYGMRGNTAVAVSNCTVEIHQHIIVKDGAIALVTLNNGIESEATTMDVPFDAFSTSLGFIKLLGNRGNFQWWGSDGDFTGYKRLLMDRMGKGRIITELGGQPEGFFVFANAMVNGSVNAIDRHGCFKHGSSSYYVPAGNTFYQGDASEFSVQKRMVYKVNGEINYETWAAQMIKVFGEHAYGAIAFGIATFFSGHIFSLLQGFPMAFYYGPGGSGKDQIIKFTQSLAGHPQPEIFLSGPNTDKGLIKMFAEFCDIIMNLAEYRNDLSKAMDELLKSMWGRIGYRIAAMRGKRTETIPINCAAMVSGNDYPNRDQALMRRLLVFEMLRTEHTQYQVEQHAILRDMQQDGYSNISAEILKHSKEFRSTWYHDHYKPSRSILLEAFDGTRVDSAMLANMQVLISTMHFFKDKLPEAFTIDQLTAYLVKSMHVQLAKRGEGSEVSNFFHCFVHAFRNNTLRPDEHFKISGNDLIFYWSDVYSAYAQAHQQIFQERGQKPSDMRAKLERHKCYQEKTKSTRIGTAKNSSAIRIDMSESGTNLKQLLRRGLDKFSEEYDQALSIQASDDELPF